MHIKEQELSASESNRVLKEILNIIIDAYDNPVRDEYKKESRCAQIGHDIVWDLLGQGIIATGKEEGQISFETDKKT